MFICATFGKYKTLKLKDIVFNKHVSGLIQRCLDYFYIFNSLQISVKNTDVLVFLSAEDLLILFCFRNDKSNRGRGFWKLLTA